MMDVGPSLKILQLSVEGLLAAKPAALQSLASKHNTCNLPSGDMLISFPPASNTEAYDLVSYSLHSKFSWATYVRADLADIEPLLSNSDL